MQVTSNNLQLDSTSFETFFNRASELVEQARKGAYRQINEILVRRNWQLGKLIVEEELKGEDRARYGAEIIKWLSTRLTAAYGKGFTKTNLYSFARFYEMFPQIFHTVSGKSGVLLSWSHYRTLIQELNSDLERAHTSAQHKFPILSSVACLSPKRTRRKGDVKNYGISSDQRSHGIY